MNKLKSSLLYAFAAISFFSGCAEQSRNQTIEQICPEGLNKQQAITLAEDVLGEMHFSIDKSDANLGVIKTNPLPGAQFFEFWRKDNVGSFNSAEANLHTIRRIAQLNINQQGTQLCINCIVNTQRLRLPEREIRSRARAYEMFSTSDRSKQNLKLNPNQKKGMTWVDLGNDSDLATLILKQIENKIAKTKKGTSL